MLPSGVVPIAIAFAGTGATLLFAPATNALAWWVMPLTFGLGQTAIGVLIQRDQGAREARP